MQIQDWSNLSELAAAASATLVGLLFVAVSLNAGRIAKSRTLRRLALQTLTIFMLPVIAGILIAIPGQSVRALGIEVVTLACAQGLALALAGTSNTISTELHGKFVRVLRDITPSTFTTLLVLVAGAVLVSGRVDGLYWLVPAIILALVGGVANAWIFLVADLEP